VGFCREEEKGNLERKSPLCKELHKSEVCLGKNKKFTKACIQGKNTVEGREARRYRMYLYAYSLHLLSQEGKSETVKGTVIC
jgi:hypothetical protein